VMYLRPIYEVPTVGFFNVYDPDTGELVAADSVVVTVRLAGAANTSVTGTFTADPTDITGVYKVQVSADFVPNVHYYWRAVVTVGSRVDVVTGEFAFGPPTAGGAVAADAGNTSTTFKIAGFMADGNTPIDDFTSGDDFDGCLIVIHFGTFVGAQIRRVTGYDASTRFITVDAALPATPADGVPFSLVSY